MAGTCIICWTLLDTSRNIKKQQAIMKETQKHWGTWENLSINTAICHRDLQAQNWRRAVEERSQKKVIPWLLSFGLGEIETPRGFQRKNPKCINAVYLCLMKWIKRQEKFGEIAGWLKGLELPWSWKYLKILSCRYLHVRCSIVQ